MKISIFGIIILMIVVIEFLILFIGKILIKKYSFKEKVNLEENNFEIKSDLRKNLRQLDDKNPLRKNFRQLEEENDLGNNPIQIEK